MSADVGLRHRQRQRRCHRAVIVGAMPDFERLLRQQRRGDGDGDRAQTVGGGTEGRTRLAAMAPRFVLNHQQTVLI